MNDLPLEAWIARLLDEGAALWTGLLALGAPLGVFAALLAGLVLLAFGLVLRGQRKRMAALQAAHDDALRRAEAAETQGAARAAEGAALGARLADAEARLRAATEIERDLTARLAAQEARLDSATRRLDERRAETAAQDDAIARLRARLEAEQAAQRQLHARISGLTQELDGERVRWQEKVDLLTGVRDEMSAKFRDLADSALRVQGEAFSKANLEKLDATLTPLKEHVGHFEKELRAVHQETARDRERLKAEIAALSKRSEEVSQEAMSLTRALRGDHQKQGAWGEMILESILERSGLRAGEEFETQAARAGPDGARLRPDVVVRIPGEKSLVIDSKVSLNDYSAAVNAEDPADAVVHRKRHVAALRAHIAGLSAKGYHLAEGSSVDYVIMFVPIEGALSEALREDGGLTAFALARHITIATPTTLMMALRTVAHVWAVERRNRNAEAIADRAGRLYDKIAGFVENMEGVGRRLDQAQSAYGEAFNQLSRGRGNVLSQAETLRELGAKATKALSVDFDAEAPLPRIGD